MVEQKTTFSDTANGNGHPSVKYVKGKNGFANASKSTTLKNQGEMNGKPKSKKLTVPPKIFVERESLLTQMFKIQEFRGLYNIFLVVFLNIVIYVGISEYLRDGKISLGWSNFEHCFGKLWQAIMVVLGLHLISIFSYVPFALWRLGRSKFVGADVIFVVYKLTLICVLTYVPIHIHTTIDFPIASAIMVALEQVRLIMKLYAFYRVNISRGVKAESGGTFTQFLYFLYAPTLIYRDAYPRTKNIRWDFVIQNFVELLGCVWFYNLLHSICGVVLLEKFGLEPISLSKLLDIMFFQMIPGGVGFLLGFFVILHISQNIAAEILRFGDREFYKDWWNSESFAEFYRNWNRPVHGFLHTYIYKETVDLGFRSKFVPAICVFLVSAVVHEYIMAFVLGFFFPALFVFFVGFGVTLSFCQPPKFGGNPFIWWSLITGNGLLLFLYSLEYFARLNNCPHALHKDERNPFWDFVQPRSLGCLIQSSTTTYS